MTPEERVEQSPGGLDPADVFNNLPEELQECFTSRNTDKLQDLINNQTKKYIGHMRDCVLSGLWVPSEDSPLYRFLQPGGENLKIAGVDDVVEGEEEEEADVNPEIDENERIQEIPEEKKDEKFDEKVRSKNEEKVVEKVALTSCLDEVD